MQDRAFSPERGASVMFRIRFTILRSDASIKTAATSAPFRRSELPASGEQPRWLSELMKVKAQDVEPSLAGDLH
jgi:hypothetical protein